MTISIGNDHAGPEYKKAIIELLESKGYTVNNPRNLKTQSRDQRYRINYL